jgi:hypothetical protein
VRAHFVVTSTSRFGLVSDAIRTRSLDAR